MENKFLKFCLIFIGIVWFNLNGIWFIWYHFCFVCCCMIVSIQFGFLWELSFLFLGIRYCWMLLDIFRFLMFWLILLLWFSKHNFLRIFMFELLSGCCLNEEFTLSGSIAFFREEMWSLVLLWLHVLIACLWIFGLLSSTSFCRSLNQEYLSNSIAFTRLCGFSFSISYWKKKNQQNKCIFIM